VPLKVRARQFPALLINPLPRTFSGLGFAPRGPARHLVYRPDWAGRVSNDQGKSAQWARSSAQQLHRGLRLGTDPLSHRGFCGWLLFGGR